MARISGDKGEMVHSSVQACSKRFPDRKSKDDQKKSSPKNGPVRSLAEAAYFGSHYFAESVTKDVSLTVASNFLMSLTFSYSFICSSMSVVPLFHGCRS